MLEIIGIESGSIAQELELEPGDQLLAIDGLPIRDLVDYLVASQGDELVLEIKRRDGEIWELEIDRDPGDRLGLVLPHPEPRQCGNNCVFCFVHQLPKGLRRSLYIKDEDYRYSYLYGAYVTLTNLLETDIERIIRQKLSPLYVSVHATDDQLRATLLGGQAPSILPLLKRLVEAGIEVHAQVVVCPGINDGPHLENTYSDLRALAPGIRSLAIVPVGLTAFRERLPALRPVQPDEALALVNWVHAHQTECLNAMATRFVFAADELYLKANHDLPDIEAYEDLPQIENGVGLVAFFRHQASEVLAQARRLDLPRISLVTGLSAEAELKHFAEQLRDRYGIMIEVYGVENRFFGGHVTVTGLLTGQDLLDQLAGRDLGQILLVPDVILREGEDVLLDDLRLDELGRRLGVDVEVIPSDPWGLWDMLDVIADEAEQ
ncbi:MAG: DUF512 domain-containing protein [Deltaproteobacteria bacterium]|nr:DUF512 domain-containing protein [Deltaproteobacteria bacterium]